MVVFRQTDVSKNRKMTFEPTTYFENNVFPYIKDFDFIKDVKNYEYTEKGVCLNSDSKNIQSLIEYENLEVIHCFRLNIEQINSFPKSNTVKSISLNRCDIKNLEFTKNFPNLIYLSLDGCNNLLSLIEILDLKKIKIFESKENMNLNDYSPLANLKNLVYLKITGTTSGTILKMKKLDWISELSHLKYLFLRNISTPKNELSPISKLKKLVEIEIPEKSKLEQIAYLSGSLPETECYFFSPFHIELNKAENFLSCNTCGESKIRLIGKGKNRVICKKCDIETFNKHMQIFNKWKNKGLDEN